PGRSRGGVAKGRSGSRVACRLVGTVDFEYWRSSRHVLHRLFATADSNKSRLAADRGGWTYRPHRDRTTPVAGGSYNGPGGDQGLRDQSSAGDRYDSHTRLVQYARGP